MKRRRTWRTSRFQRRKRFRSRLSGPPRRRFNTVQPNYHDVVTGYLSVLDDATWVTNSLDNTSAGCIFAPIRDSNVYNMIKNTCYVTGMTIRGTLRIAPSNFASTAINPIICRILVVMDKQTNGLTIEPDKVMYSGSANATTCVFDYRDYANMHRYRVLKDRTFVIRPDTMAYNGTNVSMQGYKRIFKWHIKFRRPVPVTFDGGSIAGTVGAQTTNSFHIIGNADSADVQPQIAYVCRTYYRNP